jgi:hypothetical protein
MEIPEDKQPYNWNGGWTIFSTSKKELSELFVKLGNISIGPNSIHFDNYPFAPSIAFHKKTLAAEEIVNIDLKGIPPTIRTGNELIFVPATMGNELAAFAAANQLPVVDRKDLWSWLLEPFLDTEYTWEIHERLNGQLAAYGLTEENVQAIRDEVQVQMLKYNYDTMLWDWVHLGALDALSAMRPKYDAAQFAGFYRRLMDIALLPDGR